MFTTTYFEYRLATAFDKKQACEAKVFAVAKTFASQIVS
jgi:hypothetical protein